MVELTRKEAARKGVKVKSHLDPGLPLVLIDVSRIKQVLLNLILNALQAMKEGGDMEILARSVNQRDRGQCVQLIVRDHGEGIPEKIQEQLFDPFFTTKDPGEGIGLGLTICHQIMEEHGGEIEIKSQTGVGTEAILTLPVKNNKGS
jgi:signal transduction histidine kinase